MLTCEQFEILLADHIDGELNSAARAADRTAFEEHLATCAECALLTEDAQSAVAFMGIAAEDVEPWGAFGKDSGSHPLGLGV